MGTSTAKGLASSGAAAVRLDTIAARTPKEPSYGPRYATLSGFDPLRVAIHPTRRLWILLLHPNPTSRNSSSRGSE
jgi:hypothetical protein